MPKLRNERLSISSGTKIGRLTIGDLVRWVTEHPLYEATPVSYLRQGRLWECLCECGETKLISEAHLSTGRIKSCGCLRRERKELGLRKRLNKVEQKIRSQQLTKEIIVEQFKLKQLQISFVKDENAIKETTQRIRDLIQQKLALVDFKKRVQKRRYQRKRYKDQKLLNKPSPTIND